MIIPIFVNKETPKCPNCRKEEDIKEVCNHCGYEYEYEQEGSIITDIIGFTLIIIGVVLSLIFMISIVEWITQSGNDLTLVSIIVGKFKYLYNLKIF